MSKKNDNITIRGVRGAGDVGVKKLGDFQAALLLFSASTTNKDSKSPKKRSAA